MDFGEDDGGGGFEDGRNHLAGGEGDGDGGRGVGGEARPLPADEGVAGFGRGLQAQGDGVVEAACEVVAGDGDFVGKETAAARWGGDDVEVRIRADLVTAVVARDMAVDVGGTAVGKVAHVLNFARPVGGIAPLGQMAGYFRGDAVGGRIQQRIDPHGVEGDAEMGGRALGVFVAEALVDHHALENDVAPFGGIAVVADGAGDAIGVDGAVAEARFGVVEHPAPLTSGRRPPDAQVVARPIAVGVIDLGDVVVHVGGQVYLLGGGVVDGGVGHVVVFDIVHQPIEAVYGTQGGFENGHGRAVAKTFDEIYFIGLVAVVHLDVTFVHLFAEVEDAFVGPIAEDDAGRVGLVIHIFHVADEQTLGETIPQEGAGVVLA